MEVFLAAFFLATFFLVAAFLGAAVFLAAFLATFFFVATAFFLATDISSEKRNFSCRTDRTSEAVDDRSMASNRYLKTLCRTLLSGDVVSCSRRIEYPKQTNFFKGTTSTAPICIKVES